MVSGWKSKGDQIFHFMGGMRPFMYMGEVGGGRGTQTKIERGLGSIQWFMDGGGA